MMDSVFKLTPNNPKTPINLAEKDEIDGVVKNPPYILFNKTLNVFYIINKLTF